MPPALHAPGFRRLWASRVVSLAGDGVTAVVLVLLAADAHGPLGVSLLLLAQALPHLLGPWAGAVVDRVEQRALMLACEVGQGVLVAGVALTMPPFPMVLAVAAALAGLATLFRPAGRTAVTALVPAPHRMSANGLLGVAQNLELALGALLGGLLVAGVGTRGALAVDAATFAVSALLLLGVPRLPAHAAGGAEPVLASVRAAVSFARSHRLVRVLVLSTAAVVALAGVDNVALVFLARGSLHGGAGTYGLLLSAFGAGMLVASVALAMRTRSGHGVRMVVGATALTGLGNVVTGAALGVGMAAGGQMAGGVANGVHNVASDTLVQDHVPAAMLGRVFGLIGMAAQAGQITALALAGTALRVMSPRTVFVVSGALTLIVAVAVAMALRDRGQAPGTPSATGIR